MKIFLNNAYKFYKKHIKIYVPRFVFNAIVSLQEGYYQSKFNRSSNVERFLFDKKNIDRLYFHKIENIGFKRNNEVDVSIIIPVLNKWRYTYNCLQSIKKNISDRIAYEIIIVDNASSDETFGMIKKMSGNIVYIKNEKNLGFVGGCNLGAKSSTGKYVVFLNNDTFVLKNWLESLLETFEKNEKVGLVGSKLVYPSGKLQEAGGIVWSNETAWNYGRFRNPNKYEFNYLKEVDYCSGASIMISRKIFNELGGFDELYSPAYFEDTDLAFRIRNAGYRTLYQPNSELVHFEGVTAGKNTKKGLKHYQEINKEKFFSRWKDILKDENFSDNSEMLFLARDRSKGKKIVLFIDNNVPTFDKDAGSFVTFEYLKALRDMGFKIIFWPHNLYKMELYTEVLQQLGIEVVYGREHFSDFIKLNGKFVDFAFVSRPNHAMNYIEQIRKYSSAKILYVAHDLHYLRETRELDMMKGEKELLKNIERTKNLEHEAIEASDAALFFSDKEVEIVKSEFPKASPHVLPWIQEIENERPVDFGNRKGLVFIGGYKHPPNIDAVKWFHNEIFPRLKEEIPDIQVTFFGSNPPKVIFDLDSENFKIAGFIEEEKVKGVLDNAKIFIAPLRFGAGFKGKIAKAMSNGLPVITTDIGAEGMKIVNEKNCLIANNAENFARQILKLYESEDMWNMISKNSLEHVKNNFSNERAKQELINIIGTS